MDQTSSPLPMPPEQIDPVPPRAPYAVPVYRKIVADLLILIALGEFYLAHGYEDSGPIIVIVLAFIRIVGAILLFLPIYWMSIATFLSVIVRDIAWCWYLYYFVTVIEPKHISVSNGLFGDWYGFLEQISLGGFQIYWPFVIGFYLMLFIPTSILDFQARSRRLATGQYPPPYIGNIDEFAASDRSGDV